MNRYLFILLLFLWLPTSGQYIDFGASLGGTTYQGDINHYSSRISFQGARFLKSIHLGYHFSESFAMKLRYTKTSIGAHDRESKDPWRAARNLHFVTDIKEISLTGEIELLDMFKKLQKFNLKPFVYFGITYFNFDPKASFNGKWHSLQPLSTEGQGLPGYKKPYSLHQIGLPFGFGLTYFVTPHVYVSFEIGPRITFTDFLDDVSGDYPDFELLAQFKGPTAVDLSYRADELPEGIPVSEMKSGSRGNDKDNDWYFFNSFTVGYTLNVVDYQKRRRSFREGRKCHF